MTVAARIKTVIRRIKILSAGEDGAEAGSKIAVCGTTHAPGHLCAHPKRPEGGALVGQFA